MPKKIIGVDVGGTHISAGIVADGKVLKAERIRILKTKKGFFSRLFGVIDKLIDKKTKIIGIGFPAPVVDGFVYEVQNIPQLNKTNIKKIVEQRYKVRCVVDNDANVFALAEQKYGAAKGKNNVVGITLGTGLGCGIVINGRIYSGSTGAAGEISRIPFKGKKLEDFVSARFLKKIGGKEPKELPKNSKAWKEFGKNLGMALAIVVDTLDPEVIVLGGKISNAYPLFRKYIMPEIRKNSFKYTASKFRIVKSKLKNSGVIGAALI